MRVYVRRICYPIFSLGPGERIAIWFSGCNKKCAGCISPELKVRYKKDETDINYIKTILLNIKTNHNIDGITLSGGEALDQFEPIMEIINYSRNALGIKDILLFTGYDLREIDLRFSSEERNRLNKAVSVLVTGPYDEKLNCPETDSYAILRGSMNQQIVFNDKNLISLYENYSQKGRELQLIQNGSSILLIGIP